MSVSYEVPMGLQPHVPYLPEGAEILSEELAVHRSEEGWVFYNAGGPIASVASDDEVGKRAMVVQLVQLGLLEHGVASGLLGMHRVTLYKARLRYEKDGALGLAPKKMGPKRAHKMTAEVLAEAQKLLDQGLSGRKAGRLVGVNEHTIRRALDAGHLRLPDVPGGRVSRTRAKSGTSDQAELPLQGDVASVAECGGADASGADAEQAEGAAENEPPSSAAVELPPVLDCEAGAAEPDIETPAKPSHPEAESKLVGPAERAARDAACEAGVAVRRNLERALASRGKLVAASPAFEAAEAVQYAGVLLALPLLLSAGLVEVGESVYGRLSNGYYGLRSVLLMLATMALLRIRTPEQLGGHAPGELGVLVGLDRAPEVKTLRRKLAEMGRMGRSTELAGLLAGRWAAEDPERVGLLYVDGHVRVYHGDKHRLPKAFSQRRRMCVPATTDTWVNDRDGQPVFYVTAAANEGLLAMLDDEVLPAAVQLCAGRPLTVVFDREGWSPERFQRWAEAGIRMMTYRKGSYEDWAVEEFQAASGRARGRRAMFLAERGVELLPGFWVREIRRLCSNGHQTAIVTTDFDLTLLDAAESMFDRWTQENFFRYARQDFALDHLVTRQVDSADPERLTPNPERKRVEKRLRDAKADLGRAEQELGRAALRNTGEPPGPPAELHERVEGLRAEVAALAAQHKALPKKVPVGTIVATSDLVELERERKRLTDSIKMIAYRAETALVDIVRPYYRRSPEEAHALLKAIYRTPAAILPDPGGRTLLVKLHGLSTPRATRALAELCHLMTETRTNYPGTTLRMRFETVDVA